VAVPRRGDELGGSAAASRVGANGALPVMARLTIEPGMMPRMMSNAVALPKKRFLPSRTMTRVRA